MKAITRNLAASFGLAVLASSANAATVFFDDFENGTNNATVDDTTGGYSQTADVSGSTYAASNTSRSYNTVLWVDSTDGFGSDRQGLINPAATNETATLPAAGGSQAYAFRYTNSGVTTANGVIGALTTNTIITVTFDILIDGFNAGDKYAVYLVLFNGGIRTDVNPDHTPGTTAVLAGVTGVTTATSAYQQVSFSYTVGTDVLDNNGGAAGGGTAFDSALLGQDIALRFDGETASATWDNVLVDITSAGIPEPSAALLGAIGFLVLLRRRR